MRFMFVAAAAIFGIIACTHSASAQPCQWRYSMQGATELLPNLGTATATYCGNAVIEGNLTVDGTINFGPIGFVVQVATRTAMAALDVPANNGPTGVYLTESTSSIYSPYITFREGLFQWKDGDFSELVATDTQQCAYVESDQVDASEGAWVRLHTPGIIQANWCGAVFDWAEDNPSPSHVKIGVQAAIDLVLKEIEDPWPFGPLGGFYYGGIVQLPKGAGMWDDSDGRIHVNNGVRLVGVSKNSSLLVWEGTDATVYPMIIGGLPTTGAAFSCGLKDMTVMSQQETTADGSSALIYTTTCQQSTPALENVFLWNRVSNRTLFHASGGEGGAANLVIKDTEFQSSGQQNNYMVRIEYGSSVVVIDNMVIQGDGGSYSPYGLIMEAGRFRITGGHCEELLYCILNALNTQDAYTAEISSFEGGAQMLAMVVSTVETDSKIRVCMTQLDSNDPTGKIFQDDRTGGPYNGGDIGPGTLMQLAQSPTYDPTTGNGRACR